MAAAGYDRILLLSDDAFPIYPPATLQDILSREEEFITANRIAKGSEFDRRYTDFFCYDHPATSPRVRNHYSPRIDEAFIAKISDLISLRAEGKVALDVYHGSQFWCLSALTLEKVLHRCRTDPRLCRSFEFSCLPDELMFQSIIGNYLPEVKPAGSVMFADFSLGHGPLVYSSFAELPHAVSPSNTFLRKLSPSATAFASEARARLEAGHTLLLHVPAHELVCYPQLADGGENPIYMLKLTAPGDAAATGETSVAGRMWHGLEKLGNVPYRWTASSQIEWRMQHSPPVPCTLRVVIPLVMCMASEHRRNCQLVFNGRTAPLNPAGGNLVADIEVDVPIESQKIILSTPPVVSPADLWGKADRRKLGLAIPVEVKSVMA
jgi:hypothetical protein